MHPNTVRYRLKRVSDVIGWDATGPREALILQTALILGSIGTDATRRRLPSARRGTALILYGRAQSVPDDSCDEIARGRRPILGRMEW